MSPSGRGSRYEPGKRSGTWLKYKCGVTATFLIGGYTPERGTGIGLGALLVGFREAEEELQFAGKVGSGFTAATIRALLDVFRPLKRNDPPFKELPLVRKASSWTQGFTRAS